MITTLHLCGRCASEHVRKNGNNGGRAKYQCASCGYQGYLQPVAPARAARYAQMEKRLAERNLQRSIVRATGVVRMSVAKLAKKSGASGSAAAAPTVKKGPTQALGNTRARGEVDVCRPQTAISLALAGRGTGQSAYRGLGAGHARHGHLPPALGRLAHPLPTPLLVPPRRVASLAAVLPTHAHRRDEAG